MNETGNSFITIDLAKIKSNMEKIRNYVGPDVEIMPVLKANACGHGLIRTSDWLVKECGIKRLAVAQVREAEQLRRAGSQAEIMVLGGVPVNNLPYAVQENLILPVFRTQDAALLSALAQENGRTARVHIKLIPGLAGSVCGKGEHSKSFWMVSYL